MVDVVPVDLSEISDPFRRSRMVQHGTPLCLCFLRLAIRLMTFHDAGKKAFRRTNEIRQRSPSALSARGRVGTSPRDCGEGVRRDVEVRNALACR